MAINQAKDGKDAYDIEKMHPECPIKRDKSIVGMTASRIAFEAIQDDIIDWYHKNVLKIK